MKKLIVIAFSMLSFLAHATAEVVLHVERTDQETGISLSLINEGLETVKFKYPKSKKFPRFESDSPFFLKVTETDTGASAFAGFSDWWNNAIIRSEAYEHKERLRMFRVVKLKPGESISWSGDLKEMTRMINWDDPSLDYSITFRYSFFAEEIEVVSEPIRFTYQNKKGDLTAEAAPHP